MTYAVTVYPFEEQLAGDPTAPPSVSGTVTVTVDREEACNQPVTLTAAEDYSGQVNYIVAIPSTESAAILTAAYYGDDGSTGISVGNGYSWKLRRSPLVRAPGETTLRDPKFMNSVTTGKPAGAEPGNSEHPKMTDWATDHFDSPAGTAQSRRQRSGFSRQRPVPPLIAVEDQTGTSTAAVVQQKGAVLGAVLGVGRPHSRDFAA
jgi:hypothetical protein